MVDPGKGLQHTPARWVMILLVSGLASLVLGNEFQFQFAHFAKKNDQASWQDLSQPKWDPNTASLAELELVPGMGSKLAKNILEARKTKHFKCLEDLGQIKGFGPQRIRLIGPWLQFSNGENGTSGPETKLFDTPNILKHEAKASFSKRIDPNLASAEDLETLPGIGPKLAKKIISERQIKKYDSIEDLVRVNGIGPKNIEKLRPFLFIAP